MFLASFEDLRKFLLNHVQVVSLIHNGRGVWGSDFGSCSYVISNNAQGNSQGVFRKLFERQGEVQSNEEIEANFFNPGRYPAYRRSSSDFRVIPGAPFGFWLSDQEYRGFENGVALGTVCTPAVGLQTGANDQFIRFWHEVQNEKIKFDSRDASEAQASRRKWFPYTKGGTFRKWFGNNFFVVNWEDDGREICSHPSAYPRNRGHYFKSSLTYTNVSSASFGARLTEAGFIFDQKGSMIVCEDGDDLLFILALLHTKLVTRYLSVLCPTVDFNPGSLVKVPMVGLEKNKLTVAKLTREMVEIAHSDWDNFETSWDFRDQPLLRPGLKGATLEASWRNWEAQSTAAIRRMQELETENNRLFIAAYGLDGELQPEVPEAQITLARAEARRDMAAFLSYAVGCMMGRYSPDHPGLILANAGDTIENFRFSILDFGLRMEDLSFVPDEDGVVPMLEGEWFEDDVTERFKQFLKATFGTEHFEANVRFVEESLGKSIKKYFLSDFYKDHLQTYKKRPIYWLFSSPKGTFNALIYMHRYRPDTVSTVLDYLRDFRDKLFHHSEHQQLVADSGSASKTEKTAAIKEVAVIKKQLKELEDYEKDLFDVASKKIEIDLDNGVKHNYPLFGSVLKDFGI